MWFKLFWSHYALLIFEGLKRHLWQNCPSACTRKTVAHSQRQSHQVGVHPVVCRPTRRRESRQTVHCRLKVSTCRLADQWRGTFQGGGKVLFASAYLGVNLESQQKPFSFDFSCCFRVSSPTFFLWCIIYTFLYLTTKQNSSFLMDASYVSTSDENVLSLNMKCLLFLKYTNSSKRMSRFSLHCIWITLSLCSSPPVTPPGPQFLISFFLLLAEKYMPSVS